MERVDKVSLTAFLAPLLLYVATMAPGIYNLDSAELTTAAYTGGLVRATGYPLYLVIGRAWSRLPIGDVGFRMNLLSVVCGALTIVLIERILRRLGVRGWATAGALGLLATAQYFWAMSLVAEVYTLHTALMAGVILLLFQWAESPSAKRLALATFLVGLGFGNHVATVLLAPASVWFVLRTGGREVLRPRSLVMAAGGLALGLAIYLYLPFVYSTAPAFNYVGQYDADGVFQRVDLTTLSGIWWLVSGRAFAGAFLAYGPVESIREAGHFGAELVRAFMAIGIGPGILGVVVLWRRNRLRAEMLALMFLASAGFYINYRVVDKDTMFLPAYLIWCLWVGVGYQWLLDWVEDRSSRAETGRASRALRIVFAGAVLFSLAWNGPLVSLAGDRSTRSRGEQILARAKPGAMIIGWWSTVPVIEYLQLVEGRRPDIRPVNRFLIPHEDLEELLRRQVGRRPVYLDEPPEELFPWLEGEQVGPIFRLYKVPDKRTLTRFGTGAHPSSADTVPAVTGTSSTTL